MPESANSFFQWYVQLYQLRVPPAHIVLSAVMSVVCARPVKSEAAPAVAGDTDGMNTSVWHWPSEIALSGPPTSSSYTPRVLRVSL